MSLLMEPSSFMKTMDGYPHRQVQGLWGELEQGSLSRGSGLVAELRLSHAEPEEADLQGTSRAPRPPTHTPRTSVSRKDQGSLSAATGILNSSLEL